MKKILEVLLYGEEDIRFNTDMDLKNDPDQIIELAAKIAFTMATKLWGGNETSVLAMIRILAIADLACSVNRKQMLKFLDGESELLASTLNEYYSALEKRGKLQRFGPEIAPPKMKS